MLTGISPLLSPELLACLARMGHGDEFVLADAHFPGHSLGPPTLRADGIGIAALLDAICPLLPIDTYQDDPLIMMAPVPGDALDAGVEARYRQAIARHQPDPPAVVRLARADFYVRAARAFTILITGETAPYGNLIIAKGLVDAR